MEEPMVEVEQKAVNYLALGDSYTIGQGVQAASSFPLLLKTELQSLNFTFVNEPKIIAKTGWTCADLLSNIKKEPLVPNTFDLVTVLIGVNDQYRGFDIAQYPENFTKVIQQAIDFAGTKDHVVVLSIPDYSVTPFGGGSQTTAKAIAEYNKINKKITLDLGIKYVDITPISLKAKDDLSYLASDKLHPSEKMYGEWVEEMLDEVELVLKR
jgi:lysophospholipase L1-like esterase